MAQLLTIFNFEKDANLNNWNNIDDGVMGGRSRGNIHIDKLGNGVFEGTISLENNGGFSSIRHSFEAIKSVQYTKFMLRIKGDGKRYQFRVKNNRSDAYSYIAYFETNQQWQTIEIPFSEMYPSFRGQRLNYPNFPGKQMEEISFLIGNKKAQKFKLLIDNITIE